MSAADDQITMTDAGRVKIFDTTLRDGERSPEDGARRAHDILCRRVESAIKAVISVHCREGSGMAAANVPAAMSA